MSVNNNRPSEARAARQRSPTILHILTKADDTLAREVIARQQSRFEIETIDLTAQQPDYDRLLDALFAADSVQVW